MAEYVITGTVTRSGPTFAVAAATEGDVPHDHDADYAALAHTHGVTDLTATGTRDATTYLRGDNTWATPAGGGGTSDHGALTGLGDDDHTQYLNNARGDARYSQLGHTHPGTAATMLNLVDDFGADPTGVAICNAAFQAAADYPASPEYGVVGAHVYIPPGQYRVTTTIDLYRSGVIFEGAGWGNSPTYDNAAPTSNGAGSVVIWDGAAGIPIFRLRDTSGATFRNFRIEGKDSAKPSAVWHYESRTEDTQSANRYLTIDSMHAGVYTWATRGTDYGEVSSVLLISGDNVNTDEFRITNSTFRNKNQLGYGIDCNAHTQAVWSSVRDCTFTGFLAGIRTASTLSLYNVAFNACATDLRLTSDNTLFVKDWQSENSNQLAILGPYSKLIVNGGRLQCTYLDNAEGGIIAASPTDNGQKIHFDDVEFWGTVPASATIAFGPTAAGDYAASMGFSVLFRNCRGLRKTKLALATGASLSWANNTIGVIEWDCFEDGVGHERFRNQIRGSGGLGDAPVRTAMDKTVWDMHPSVAGAHDHDALYDALGSASTAQTAAQNFATGLVNDLSGVDNPSAARAALNLGTAATTDSTAYDPAGSAASAQAAAIAASQPLDSDLTAIAALTTTAYGRSFLALADAAAGRTALGLGSAAVAATGDFDPAGSAASAQAAAIAASQPLDSDLTAIAALTTTAYGRAFLALADAAAGRTALGLGTAATTDSTAYEAAGAITTHSAATDPHGDRAWASDTFAEKGPYASQQGKRIFTDEFDRADGPLDAVGTRWVDGGTEFPDSFEPLGILSGKVVIPDPMTRPGTYDTLPISADPPTGGQLYMGIGCAWRDTGSRAARVLVRWSGNIGVTEETHVEATPLLHVTPGSTRFGFGVWPTEILGAPALIAGYICDPPEQFANYDIATHAMTHTDDTERDIECVSDGENVKVYLDGVLLTNWSTYGTDLPLDASVKHSTMHGFAVDAHLTDPALTPTLPALTRCEVEALDSMGWLKTSGGTVTGAVTVNASTTFDPGTNGRVEVSPDSASVASLKLFPSDAHTHPAMSFGSFIGTPLLGLGSGTADPDAFLARSAAGALAVGLDGSGVMVAGRRHVVNAQTGTAYTVVLADQGKMITRSNASASTMEWPANATAIPVGTCIEVLNLGAGTITHSAAASAGLVTGSTTTQAQGKRLTAFKVGTGTTNTWLLA
jgi:hypothetical protein